MSQHDYSLANADGATFRSDLNNALSAIVSLNSGASAPSTTYPYMLWADTTNGLLKMRNAGDSAWVTVMSLAAGGLLKTSATGSAALPLGTTAQQDASPQAGYFRFNTTNNAFEGYDGSGWGSVGGATGAGGDQVFYENDQIVTTSYAITSGKNASSVGEIEISTGVTVTIPTGSNWVVL
jgi:hypothetical protein